MLQTGDLLFFRGDTSSAIDRMIMEFTGSVYTHVAMVIKDPRWMSTKGLFCIQSNSSTQTAVEQGDQQSGVVITPVSEMRKYDLRRLTTTRDEAFYDRLATAHAKVHNMPYDFSLLDWARTGLYSIGLRSFATPRHTNNFWCSALVAFMYREMALLNDTLDWSNQTPGSLALIDIVLPNILSPMIVLHEE